MIYENSSKSNYLLKRIKHNYSNSSVVILGQNGEGKSRLLVELIGEAKDYEYKNVIAVSTSPFDKFPIRKKYNDITYNYVGVKGGGSGNSILSLISSASLGLLNRDKQNDRNIERILSFLGASSEVEYVFKITPKLINYYEGTFSPLNDTTSRLSLGLGEETVDISYNDLEDINFSSNFLSFATDSNNNFKVRLKIGEDAYIKNKKGQIDNINTPLKTLLKFDLIKLIDFRINKNTYGWMSLRLASSGEQCILLSMLGIATNICNNSLILIDEPEISLHPEWQEKYISLLMRIFERYNSCLFVIATHSPQIVSKLDPFRSFIYTIKNDELESASEYVKKSSDYQLANLFLAPGYKNEYLTRELITFLTSPNEYMESNKSDEIKKIISLSANLDPSDPVFKLIEIARKVISEI